MSQSEDEGEHTMADANMKVRIGNLELDNPFILGAGPPGMTGASLKRFATAKPGAVKWLMAYGFGGEPWISFT